MLALTRSLISNGLHRQRYIHTGVISLSATQSPLYKLRQRTGLAYTLCREALNKHDNNIEEAEAWLKAHALAHGIQKANKVRDRSAREGLVCLSIPKDNKFTTIVELNCETDFVAKNQIFKDFAIDITEQISSNFTGGTKFNLPDHDVVFGLKSSDEQIKDIENQIVPMISKLGENIKLSRAIQLHPSSHIETTRIFGRIHAQTAARETDLQSIMAGRFGAIVALRRNDNNQADNSMKPLGDKLCQHVIGYSPSYIELPDNIRRHLEEAEREKLANKVDDGNEVGEGDLSDHEGSQSATNNRDDWPSIMDQTLIMTDDLIVRDLCKMNNISIVYFNRFECGMES